METEKTSTTPSEPFARDKVGRHISALFSHLITCTPNQIIKSSGSSKRGNDAAVREFQVAVSTH
jgi:hypothetical protein